MRSHLIFMRVLTTAGLLCVALGAQAQAPTTDKARAERDARRFQQLQQRFEEEKAALVADKAALQKKLADKDQEIAQLKAAQARETGAVRNLTAAKTELSDSNASLQKQLSDQTKAAADAAAVKAAELERIAQQREQERQQGLALNAEQAKTIEACQARNEKLALLSGELLDRYRNKGLFEVAKHQEPVLQFGEVELFNYVQDTRDRIAAERIKDKAAR